MRHFTIPCIVAAVAIHILKPGLAAGQDITKTTAAREDRAQYAQVVAYLGHAGLIRFVNGSITPHGSGGSFHVTFTLASDDQSKAEILTILRNTKTFNIGRFGSRHAKDVDAAVRTDAFDFRSRNGVLGPRSLEVMINHKTLWGYADIDRYDMYGGMASACAHIVLEFLPDKVWRLLRGERE
jgi:hypothetical protein